MDAETGLEWLLARRDVDKSKIFVFGSSLGGAVSVNLTSDPRYSPSIAGLILENTFTSLPDVAQSLLNINVLDFLPTFCHKNQVGLSFFCAPFSWKHSLSSISNLSHSIYWLRLFECPK